ncbi:hypothetical protein OROGR_017540 [Orobanche gracilis]
MVFSSIQAYLDPSKWQQHQNHQIIGSSSSANSLPPPPPRPAGPDILLPPPHTHGVPSVASIRPGSMAERARLANVPMPEAALKCPRCESTNTKFCYFNNYNLSQPRHFCKTCRRYWTRNGALRNIPVGGGCRRNKRSKSSSSSKSTASGDSSMQNNNNNDNNNNPSSAISSINHPTINSGSAANLLGLEPQLAPLRFMSPLAQLSENLTSDHHMGLSSYWETAPNGLNFHSASSLHGGSIFSGDGGGGCGANIEPWRLHQAQQFPFLGGTDQSSAGIYQFYGGASNFMAAAPSVETGHHHVRSKFPGLMPRQIWPVKMEENPNELNLSRQLLGNIPGNDQWNSSTANWTDLSSFSSSSTSNHS